MFPLLQFLFYFNYFSNLLIFYGILLLSPSVHALYEAQRKFTSIDWLIDQTRLFVCMNFYCQH